MFDKWKKKAAVRAYHEVFESPEGKVVLKDMCKAHHVWSTSFTPDSNLTSFREGERNVLLRIFKILNLGEHELSNMISEAEQGE